MISYMFEKLNWRQQQNNLLYIFCGYFFSLIHVKFLYNVNENGRNYEEKNEGGNETGAPNGNFRENICSEDDFEN